jgi:hypothetical protein
MASPKYRWILLKPGGESLTGKDNFGIDPHDSFTSSPMLLTARTQRSDKK